MKSSIIEVTINKPFDEAINNLRSKITANGFLVLHEINTTEILSKHGIIIDELRQILFFHPKYMKDVLSIDPLLVNEVPLKIVVRSISGDKISLSIANPTESMSDYNNSQILSAELLEKINQILAF
ncbi:MAG: DUF302 domain-containing protein [Bacteroidales bacterium]|nr:DUF302 domain-containing protein [Bacteroidales bacterium]